MHVHTGLPTLAGDIDAWLAAQGVDAVTLNDAFDACQHLLTSYEQAPELAFVGVDRLERDERQLVRFLRETWPGIAVVLYGGNAAAPWSADALVTAVDCRASLRDLLACTPAELIQRIRRGQARVASRLAAPPPAPEPPRRPPLGARELEFVRAACDEPGLATTAPAALRVTPMESTSVSLTAEELAALLDAADD
jgi:hypothetical protein